MRFKRGQVTIFIILAILIVAGAFLVFVFKDSLFNKGSLPSEIEPIYTTFISCLEQDLERGVKILESQGGYIFLPEYEDGSEYMPFSSQLDFLGNPIPYWYYISGNGIPRTQVPSKDSMEKNLEMFMETKSRACFFDDYYSQGYWIDMEKPKAKITIKDHEVVLDLKMDLIISRENENHVIREHKVVLDSELGSLYESAIKVYEEEQSSLFLEDYAIDILRLYAPVDGFELTCSPKVWIANEIFRDLREAIEANTLALKNSNNKEDYFEVEISDIPSNHRVRFLNSKDWTYSFEVNPSDGPVMTANPVGNQPGLDILGFCYVPYHFVYSLRYPVLIQIISGKGSEEIFQFPMAVVIERNLPRNASGESVPLIDSQELCTNKNTYMNIQVYDTNLKPIEAYVSYSCLGSTCSIGTTKNGRISEKFPQCINGFINVKSEGYKPESIMYSTVKEGVMSVYLSKLYNLSVQLKLNNQNYNRDAIIYFVSDDFSKTIYYPRQKYVELAEGEYEVQVYVYKNSNLKVGNMTQKQCVEVPRSSIGGLIGLTKEVCFDVQVPAQTLSNALSAGGKLNYTFSENQLRGSRVIDIYAETLPEPNTLEQIQKNYNLFENKELKINLR
ncbi:MAG TPA: hypothetical protein PLT60_00815 [Candidatus Pacearchaeota archaeon]|jgi:hypothetical protein|nr:hypothetical protein [Methanofastidiosum sp.]HNZ51943.1 hypothetical protein [Candidatus Pacearchaeota archaeon]HOH04022.1 hypothetical protein [Candidatus Pacearchaeota archaeon]HPX74394.1 hypothetical protein [Candidatus Pacearchaeota archaeon]